MTTRQMKLIIFCLIVCCSVAFGAAKKTGWEKDGLKGKVKQQTKISYNCLKGNSGAIETNFKDKIIYKYYTNSGNSIEEANYNAAGELIGKDIDRYDIQGNRIEKAGYKADGTLGGKHIYKYNDQGNIIDDRDYNFDGLLNSKVIYKYNDQGNMIEKAEYEDGVEVGDKIIYKIDAQGNRIEADKYLTAKGLKLARDILASQQVGSAIIDTMINRLVSDANGSLCNKEIDKYDSKGNRIGMTNYNLMSGSIDKRIIYKYNDQGNIIEERDYKDDGSVDKRTVFKYDDQENIIEESCYKSETKSGEDIERLSDFTKYKYEYYDLKLGLTNKRANPVILSNQTMSEQTNIRTSPVNLSNKTQHPKNDRSSWPRWGD